MNKSGKLLLAFTIVVMVLSSCEKVVSIRDDDKEVHFHSAIQGQLLTRLDGSAFEVDDAIGVFMKEAGEALTSTSVANRQYIYGDNSLFSAAGEANKIYFPETGEVNFVAYYPYQAGLTKTYNINVANQSDQGTIDLLYAETSGISGSTTSVAELTFSHELSKVEITVSTGLGVGDLDGLTVEFRDFFTTASYHLADQTISGYANAATIAAKLTTNGNTLAEAILLPGSVANKQIVFAVGGKTYEYTLPMESAYDSGTKYTYNVTLNDAGDATGLTLEPTGITDWADGLAVNATLHHGTGTTYYVDSDGGDDENNGRSESTAWRSLSKVNTQILSPGSKLLFKAGGTWIGQLAPLGSGEPNKPIVIDQYGAGPKPLFHGNGLIGTGTVRLYNQSYWEINNLEITNSSTTPQERRGVEILGTDHGLLQHIYLNNLTIHDVNGTVGNSMFDKKSAAIFFSVTHDNLVPTRFHDIRVENCLIYNIENQGIVTNNDVTVADYPGTPDWERRRVTNLLIRNNTIHHISKNAMIIRLADGGLVERNLCHDTSYGIDPATGENIGGNIMFSRSSKNTVFQYNEGYNNKGTKLDGSMYDPDLNSPGTIWQYSYSHDNHDGLFLSCTSPTDAGIVCRYNISQNDKNALVFFNFEVSDIKVYNNTFYIGEGLSPRIIQENSNWDHTYTFQNNIVYNHPNNSNNPDNGASGVRFSFAGEGSVGVQNRTITDNIFYNTPQPSQINFTTNLTSDPMFVDPGTATTGLQSVVGYKLRTGSPALGTGQVIHNNGGRDYFGNAVSLTASPNVGFYNGPGT